jgi:ring-1,2-phenylacetyl-CoA epoxidase subunit PaaE
MAKFNKLRVADVRTETADCVSVAFHVPDALKTDYVFKAGQYLTLKLFVGGEELRRSYSICTSPVENELRVAVKRVQGGKGSNYINDKIKPGEEIDVMTPMGSFHSLMHPSHKINYVLFAGGSGITPMLSIIKTVLSAEPNSTIQLFYGNLNEQATIFKKQIDALAAENSNRLNVYYIFDKPQQATDVLFTGLMTNEKITELVSKFVNTQVESEFFICGPSVMMENAKQVIEGKGIAKQKIHIEYFTSVIAETTAAEKKVESGAGGESTVTVIMDGAETTMQLSEGGKVILDAALDAGVDVPYACKGAVCCTCRAKVLEGKVKMDNNFALTEDEVAEGFILTCQAHPLTPVVKVDYDC